MNSKFKSFLVLLALTISISCYAQIPTLVASAKYSAVGSGSSGVPSISFNVPSGKNRVMLITTITERYQSPANTNWPASPNGTDSSSTNSIEINVNGLNTKWLSGNFYNSYSNAAQTNSIYYFHNSDRYISDIDGLPTGNVTITFPGLNLPTTSGDEMSVIVSVYENVGSISRIAYTGSQIPTGTTVSNTSTTIPAIPIGRSVSDLLYVAGGACSQSTALTISGGWTSQATTMNNVVINNNGSSTGLSPNEPDGISQILGYRYGSGTSPAVTFTRTPTGVIERGTAHIFALFPLAKPSVSGTVYIDNNGFTGGINGGGTGGGIWSTANALYVNAIDTNGNVVATALVNTSGVFSFPSGGNLIEGDVIRFQLSKTQGTVGQPAPVKELPFGWGTVGESITSGASDGTIDSEFTLTIGNANSPNNTTNRFGVTTCAAGAVAPEVTTPLSISCPATTINLNIAHTGTVPNGSSLVWFTNSTHTGAALSGTQITQATAGTYYVFYYDSANNCYSPAATVNILANTTDSDGDGILDTCDLDDDNDGILDTNECQSSDRISNGVFPTSGSLTGWTTSGSYSLTSRGLEFTADNSTITTVSQSLTGVFANSNIYVNDINWLTTNTSGATSTLVTEFLYNGTVYATIDTGAGVAGSIPTVRGYNGAVTNISTLPSIVSTGTWSTTNTDLIITLPPTISSSSGTFQIRFRAGTSGTSVDDIAIASVGFNSCSDYDADGIPNYLDLDSDGDGCIDAVEGSGNYNPSTIASGTISSQSPNINFGTSVDNNGIPTTVGASGQGIGQSQDTIKDCKDSDGDGIPDWQDLDDDNDGILDCVENGLNTTVDKIFKANNNATLITNPSSGPIHQYRLTNGGAQNGQIWSYGKVDFTKSFTLSMKALLSGADGIAIVFHNSPAAQLASGTNGQGLGARGIANGIALELDTFANSCLNDVNNGANCDPSYDHGSIRTTADWINSGKLAGDTQLGDGTVDDGVWHDVIVNWNAVTRNLSYTFDGIAVTNYTFPTTGTNALETILAGNSAYFGYTASTGGAGSNNSVGFDTLCTLPIYLDTDRDGISNHLDLDSDGDGCTDAIEGAGTFTSPQLTTALGNISSQTPNQNFGTSVDANGIPTLVGASGQAIGQSQDISKNDCLDTDGDGYPDWQDLDDDNDGILDTVECSVTDLVTNGTFTGNANNWTLEGSWTYNTNRVANSADGETSRLLQSLNNLDKLPNNLIPLTFTMGAQDASNASGSTSALEVRLNGVVYATFNNGTDRNNSNVTITLESGVMSNFTTFGTSAVNGYTNQTFTLWIPYTGPSTANLVFRKVGGNDDWLIDDVSIPAMICDTDGDGILDHLDLDSDGDGCPDSIEGAGNFTNSQLTSASGTISSQTPNLNFGVAVDTNGVPTTVGASGQATGQSKDKFKNDCLDFDGDGYPNWQDLDDDNDGILDTDELACATSTDKTLNYFFNTSSGNYINTASPTFFYNYSSLAHQDGTGVTSTIVSDVLRVTGVTTSATRDNNDYLDFPFVISDEGNYALSSIKLRNTGSGRAYKYDVVLSSDNFATSTPLVTGASVTGLDNTIYFSSTFTPVALVPGTIYKLRFYLYNRTGSDPTDFDNMSIDISGCDYKDTDGDGILDHLDLDSDGDGCPDAIEGGESFTTSHLTTASGTLSSQIPNLNFGVAVDTNGVPTTVGASGQATGQSKDKFKNDCLDSDGDGYPDWQDLDDDNDGVLDLVECVDTRAERVVWSNSIAGNLDAPTYLSGYTSGTELTAQDATQIGVGIGRTFTGTRQDITGVNSSSEALAIANNEYVEYEINVGNTPFIFTNLGWYVQQSSVSNVGYRFTVHISDNNFISSRNVLNDTQYVPTASGSNMVQLITNGSLYLESSKIYKFRVYFYRTDGNPSNLTFAHDDFKIYGYLECDTDGDGIPDRLDLDSDNDGCLDAIEGGANIATSQLVNSGGTVTVGIGSSATNQNLCSNSTCVDTNGVPNIVGASGQTVGDSQNTSVNSQCNSFCYKPAIVDAGNNYPSKHGITSLGRAGAQNDNWPMVRQSAWTVLESKEKGFVVNRIATTAGLANITNPVEGMMVYDEQADCLKIYTLKSGDTIMGWHCFITPACPD